MMRLSVSYTKAINKRYDRVGSLFQAKHVTEDAYLVHLSRYVHLNPVLADLSSRPEEWEYSSYREYIGLRGGTLPEPGIVLAYFGSPAAYRTFVQAYVPKDRQRIAGLLFD